MDKNAIKKYATWARQELIKRIIVRAASYGVTEKGYGDINADNVNGRVLSAAEQDQRRSFIRKIRNDGYEQAIEEVAYTWFNRFCALRYMEVNGYLPAHIRVFTNTDGEFKPQILAEASHLDLEGLDIKKVYAFKNANDTEGLYRYLLITQCNALSDILPGMFQKIEDYSELLMPDNLLREGNVLEQMITQISEDDWKYQIQIIGWLYQYYNAEKKDEIFAALKRNVKITKENIPAATQLFTPDWIVRYMVENSLGRLWVEGHPNKKLQSSWKYYLEEAKQEPNVEKKLEEIRKESAKLKPADIRCIDPCAGSGHILVYLFDVLMQIYESYGYTRQQAVKSIVENNLYGLDIDDRAAQLAYFAVMMKARSYDRNFFGCGIQPHVYAIEESNGLDKTVRDYFVGNDKKLQQDLDILVKELKDAKEYGSIINVTPIDFAALYARVEEVKQDNNLYDVAAVLETVLPLIQVGKVLAHKYDVVVTNPPYMGGSNMNGVLAKYVKANYPNSKSDMSTVCMEKAIQICQQYGYVSMINIPVWMFLSTYEKLRCNLLANNTIISMVHPGRGIFGSDFGTVSFVLKKGIIDKYKGTYYCLFEQQGEVKSPEERERALLSRKGYYSVKQTDFSKIPGSPVTYWVGKRFYENYQQKSIADYAEVITGMNTGDNNKYLRLWHEVNIGKIAFNCSSMDDVNIKCTYWIPYSKGGPRRNWYGNYEYIVNWSQKDNFNSSKPTVKHLYLKEAVTWPFVTMGDFSSRILPKGSLWDVAGSPCFFNDLNIEYITLAVLCSKVANYILKAVNPTINVQAANIAHLPLLLPDIEKKEIIVSYVKKCLEISKNDWDSFEVSWGFKEHPLVQWSKQIFDRTSILATMRHYYPGQPNKKFNSPLELCYLLWQGECNDRFQKLKENEEELNRIFIDIYGLQSELTPEVRDKDVTVRLADKERDIKSFISYAVGCMFGRYSLDKQGLVYAGSQWDDSNYNSFIPDDDAIIPICDDEYFSDDIVGRFVEFIEVVYGKNTLEKNLQFIAEALGGREAPRDVIRNYFLNDFYADHCKIYQKRPIYWLFDSGKKNGFKCLIYLHRYKPEMVARIRTNYIHEQQSKYLTTIADMGIRIKDASTSERVKLNKKLVKFEEQTEELRKYEEKIHHLADQFIEIDLDDGVKVNYAKFHDVLAKIK